MLSHLCIIFSDQWQSVTRFVTKHKDIYVPAAKLRVDFQYVGKTFVQNGLTSVFLPTHLLPIHLYCVFQVHLQSRLCLYLSVWSVCLSWCVFHRKENWKWDRKMVICADKQNSLKNNRTFSRSTWLYLSERKHLVDDARSQHKYFVWCWGIEFLQEKGLGRYWKGWHLTFITECEGTRVLMLCKKTSLYCVAETSTVVSMLAI